MRETTKKSWLVSFLLLAGIAAIFVLSFLLAPKPGAADGEAFGGTDALVTEHLEATGVEPWFHPLVELGSGELESGLFALQAAIGASIGGYALGNLRGRAAARRDAGADPSDVVTLTEPISGRA